MDERIDAQLSTVAVILIVVLLFGQIVLLAAHLWAPLARTADRLIEDEHAPLPMEALPDQPQAPASDATAPQPDPWRWVALAMTALGAGLGLFAVWRVHDKSAERNRWLAVLVIAILVVAWGSFTFRLIARSSVIFEGF
ncbi:MAG: hypothetical protein ACOX9R_08160 [Armatimonadota bacterium]|jgi:hypothetical protein